MDSLFLDNNIPIGFCFRQDPQHTFAEKLFNHSCSMNWSNNVEHEFNKVFKRKREAFDDLILYLNAKLKNMDVDLNRDDVIKISISFNMEDFGYKPLEKLFIDFWDDSKFDYYAHSSEISKSLNKYKKSFNKKLLRDKGICFKKIYSHTRKKNYPNVEIQLEVDGYDNLKKLGNDMNICLDAHDLGHTINKLKFVTDDTKILGNKTNIESVTKIYKVLGISDYSFNEKL